MRVGRPALLFSLHGEVLGMDEKKKGVSEIVWEMAEPLLDELGLILWDVNFLKEGADWILRITIDKEDGVSIDDCVAVNEALDLPLDECNPIDRPYRLQVQSPGVERKLVRDWHFTSYIGSRVKLKLQKALNEKKEYSGELLSYENGEITLRLDDGDILKVQKSETSFVKLDDLDDFQF